MEEHTKEYLTIQELKKVSDDVETYIDTTVELLMEYGMSEQDAFISIIKRFNKILKLNK